MLEVKQLSVGYKLKPIVSKLDFQAKSGELIAVVGRNGTGKTTFLKTMTGLLPALSGQVEWKGQNLLSLSIKDRAKIVSLVHTKMPQWTGLSVSEVIALGAYPGVLEVDDPKVIAQLKQFGLSKIQDERLDSISDGERQKTMIARALIQDTPLMIMDEPTSFLDYESKVEWWALLNDLKREGKIIIVSSHDLDLLKKQPIDQYWKF